MPVILGEARARRVAQVPDDRVLPDRRLARSLVGWIGPWVLLVVLGIPRLVAGAQGVRQPEAGRPAARLRSRLAAVVRGLRPSSTPGAPAGCFILGLLLNALLPVTLPWL